MALEGLEVNGSPTWWIQVLGQELVERRVSPKWSRIRKNRTGLRPSLDLLASYREGDPPLPKVADGWKEGMREFLRLSRMNYADMAITSASDRMNPVGWRTALDEDRDGDKQALEIAAANNFEILFPDLMDDMLTFGSSYGMLGKPRRGSDIPVITNEDPRDTIMAHDPATGDPLAGMKMFRDDWDSRDLIYVHLPGGQVWVAFRKAKTSVVGKHRWSFNPESWEWDEDASGQIPNFGGTNRIAMTEFRNRRGVGEYEPHLDVLDRINDTIFKRVALATHQAFRQRGLIDLPDEDDDGNPIDYSDAFLADPGALWKIPAGTSVWESGTTDIGPIRMAVKDDVAAFAGVVRMPLHYVTPDAAQGSAEGASTMKESNVIRVEDRCRIANVGLRDLMSNAFAAMGDKERAERSRISTIWAPVERYNLVDRTQAAAMAKAAGVGWATRMTDYLGYRPSDLDRLQAERAEDLLYEGATPPLDVNGIVADRVNRPSPQPGPQDEPPAGPTPARTTSGIRRA